MVLHIYRRPDGALVIVPALFQPPIALEREGMLVLLGEADVELAGLSDAVVEQLGLQGYAVAGEVDAAILRHAVAAARPPMPASGEQLPI